MCFGWMKDGCQEIQLVHSCAKYGGFDSSADIRGKVFGFSGDRDAWGGQPMVVKMPRDDTWQQAKFKWKNDAVEMATYFAVAANRGTAW